MNKMISRVKGTRDILDPTLLSFVIDKIKSHLEHYGFSGILTPILEYTKLFQRSLGEYTDVVTKEMFIVQTEPTGESICLRPEATVPTVRAFIENKITQRPWKVYSYGPMFRYERPQKGRYRQFYQCNIEIIGAASIAYDAELILMLDRLFHECLLLTNYALKINFLGDVEERKAYLKSLKHFLHSEKAKNICSICKVRAESNAMRVFDCKEYQCQEIYKKAPVSVDYLSESSQQEWQALQKQLELLSVSFSYDPMLVRGLDYYSKTVFEFVSSDLGSQNAFCGGGRYNTLLSMLGAKEDEPALGAAIGIDRLLLLLMPIQEQLSLPQADPLYIVLPVGISQQSLALLLADELRAKGLVIDILFDGSIKSRMRKANKLGAKQVILVGDNEQANREVIIKDMIQGVEKRIAQIDIATYLKKRL